MNGRTHRIFSFRNRLAFFFVIIVVAPMLAATVSVFVLLGENERSKADARVAEGQQAAIGLYRREVARAAAIGTRVARDAQFTSALVLGDRAGARARAARLRAVLRLRRLAVVRGRDVLVDVGVPSATAPATRRLVGSSGTAVGSLQTSVTTAAQYASLVKQVTGREVVVQRADRTIASTLRPPPAGRLPAVGDVEADARTFRVATFRTTGFRGDSLRVSVLSDEAETATDLTTGRAIAAAALVAFLALAVGFALAVSRSLQAQIERFLAGARRVAAGDFSTEVPVEGRDEFAALGEEFNKMSRQLETRLEELSQERARLEDSIRRIGESFASNLDRDGLLEIVVRTAVDAVGADCGRATARDSSDGPLAQRTAAGDLSGFGEAIHAAEALVHESGESSDAAREGSDVLAFPLRLEQRQVMAMLSVARAGRPFTTRERDLFNYLARQAAVSLENVDLHEQVHRQAVTDELTGLSNHRRFQDVIHDEVERARRFEHSVGLVMLDIDDFKAVNDRFGHQQGDLVLREVGRVVGESSREIDEPARYGGEELAVALPETGLEGTYNLAERIRTAIEELRVRRLDGRGTVQVTASFGAAALPENATDRRSLVAAADAALYRAKRAGKNRTERAAVGPRATPAS